MLKASNNIQTNISAWTLVGHGQVIHQFMFSAGLINQWTMWYYCTYINIDGICEIVHGDIYG